MVRSSKGTGKWGDQHGKGRERSEEVLLRLRLLLRSKLLVLRRRDKNTAFRRLHSNRNRSHRRQGYVPRSSSSPLLRHTTLEALPLLSVLRHRDNMFENLLLLTHRFAVLALFIAIRVVVIVRSVHWIINCDLVLLFSSNLPFHSRSIRAARRDR